MTVKDAAEYLGCSEQWVRKLISENKLSARLHGRAWVVSKASLDRHIAKRNK